MSEEEIQEAIKYNLDYLEGNISIENELEEAQKEIERLKKMKLHTEKYASEMEDKYILEKYKNNKAIEYIEHHKHHNDYFLLKSEVKELFKILKGVDKE